MKQLKAGTWRVIKDIAMEKASQLPLTPDSEPMEVDGAEGGTQNPRQAIETTFNEACKRIPSVVTRKCAESMSTSLVFYSVLHLCNERGIDIRMHSDLEDFTIIAPPMSELEK